MNNLLDRIENLSPAKRKLLERMSARTSAQTYPLSYAQQRLWFIDQLEAVKALYNMPLAIRLTGPVDKQALSRSLQEIVRRHETLRTRFPQRNGVAVQEVMQDFELKLEEVDLRHIQEEEGETETANRLLAKSLKPFDLEQGGLIRTTLFQLKELDHVLLINMHHIVSDGWSIGILEQELATLYAAYHSGLPSPLPALELQYGDFTVWQRGWLKSGPLQKQMEYWKQQLQDIVTVELPTDNPRPPALSHNADTVEVVFPAELTVEIKQFCRREKVTLFMALLTGLQLALSSYTGTKIFAVGTPIANRNRVETEKLIGCFINTLVLRADLRTNLTFRELLATVRETTLGAYEHQDMPFEKLVEEFQPVHDLSRTPLFQVLFVLQNVPSSDFQLPAMSASTFDVGLNLAKVEMTVTSVEREGKLFTELQYDVPLFERVRMERLIECFRLVLHTMTIHPEQKIWASSLLPTSERQQMLEEWNRTEIEYEEDQCVNQLLEEHVAGIPDAVAVICEEQQLTYAELHRRGNQLASYLQKLGVRPEMKVGICVERSLDMIIALLGILKSGAAYVPLDPNYPVDRLRFMARDADLKLLLVHDPSSQIALEITAPVVNLSRTWQIIACQNDQSPQLEISADNLAYVVYTSGSTGRSKGVGVSHRALYNQLCWATRAFRMSGADCVLQKASFSFDASIVEVLTPLVVGARIVAARAGGEYQIQYLAELVARELVTLIDLPPSLLQTLLECSETADWHSVRLIISGGEALRPELIRSFRSKFPTNKFSASLVNTYGPTETTVQSTLAEDLTEKNVVPIGRPIANTKLYVLREGYEPVPVGAREELYIGGVGLARGYLARPELTAEQFVPNPFSRAGGERLYRTGDVVRWHSDGNLEFVGRMDRQVKLRGYRIELGEIESALESHEEVEQAVVVCEDQLGLQRLVGYVKKKREVKVLNIGQLRTYLKERLPAYMIPTAMMELEGFPLTPNGKIDRKSLLVPEGSRNREEQLLPRTPTEEILLELWEGLLKQKGIGREANFFELGGHSLLAMQLISRIRNAFTLELPLRVLFEVPTLMGMAKRIEQQQRKAVMLEIPALVPVGRGQPLPLSYAQQRLWFLEQLGPGRGAYNIQLGLRLKGKLKREAMRWSWEHIVRRHEVLRTLFPQRDGVPLQEVAEAKEWKMEEEDLREVCGTGGEREEEVRRQVEAEAERRFDLARELPLRVRLLQVGEEDHVLLVNLHHIVSDGWSMGILEREFSKLYQSYGKEEAEPWSELVVQYGDYAVWQRTWLQGEVLEKQVEYWKKKLEGLEALALPADQEPNRMGSHVGDRLEWGLTKELSDQIKEMSRREGVTVFMTLLAGWQLLLSRYSGQRDVAVGTPVAGRRWSEIEDLIGFFVNTLVLRTEVRGEVSFSDLLKGVRETILEAYEHQDVPFEKLVEELRPERDLNRTPLFQVMFALQNMGPSGGWSFPGVKVSGIEIPNATEKFDMSLAAAEEEGRIHGQLSYRTDLFEQARMKRLVGHYERLLGGVAAEARRAVSQIPMMSAGERNEVLYQWNEAAVDYPQEKCVHELFEEQVKRSLEAVAVLCEDAALSYGELNRRANQLAHYLRSVGVKPDARVAICMERSKELIVGVLAVLKAGGAYVPLDPTYPVERLSHMVSNSGSMMLLTRGDLDGLSHAIRGSLPVIDLAGKTQSWSEYPATDLDRKSVGLESEHLAYIIYTSGSTGLPKGVMIEHRSLSNYLQWADSTYYQESGSGSPAIQSVGFDGLVTTLFGPIIAGQALTFFRPGTEMEFLGHEGLCGALPYTLIKVTPSHLKILNRMISMSETNAPTRILMIGGEALVPSDVVFWQRRFPEVRLVNHFGPTETTVGCCALEISAPIEESRSIPIGRPIANTEIYILDADQQPVPMGVMGELYIGGAGLARGYLNQPGPTGMRFIPDAFAGRAGARMYRTGDLGRRLADGTVEFLGRNDFQVKIRGNRIELGEIEARLREHDGVGGAVVVVREDQPGLQRLVGYVEKKRGVEVLNISQLRAYLKERLPAYMIPTAMVELEKFPLTPNGKIDRKNLPEPEAQEYKTGPRDLIELQLLKIWEEILKTKSIGMHESFFDLGGHSLLAVQLQSLMEQRLNKRLPLAALFRYTSIAQLAGLLRRYWLQPGTLRPNHSSTPRSPIIEMKTSGSRTPLFFVHGAGGSAFAFTDLVRHVHLEQPFLAFQDQSSDDPVSQKSIESIAQHYLGAMRMVQANGPYLLGGWSMGGLIAFEMARQLQRQEQPVGLLALVDSYLPESRHEQRENDPVIFNAFLLTLGFRKEDLESLDGNHEPVEHRLARAEELGVANSLLPSGVHSGTLLKLFNLYRGHIRAIATFRPQFTNVTVHLWRAQASLVRDEQSEASGSVDHHIHEREHTELWTKYAAKVHLATIPGNHFTLLREPHVRVLAQELSAACFDSNC